MINRDDPLWYKDAIIYQTHVKAYHDSTDDGIGDFAGLTQKLDYIQDLGVTVVWVLPFYPSPLRDDGYDIAEYKDVNPSYGTLEDAKRFVEEAHRRGLRVITELVINHTSDQHPWFQRARNAPPGSPERDFYVWSDTDAKWPETRIIFTDTEKSNWAWDPVANAYYWHRFFSHQPDLNFDNPAVLDAVLEVMDFWLDIGVDGLRLDAIPYLVERDGTNNENLPETHVVLKKIRAHLDKRYNDRMLLAEANQWPEDTRPYFGDGDECHMGFHFPLMPRMYMSLAQEDRAPITDIMRQTPEIPENCQWAIFLRNHDELTLEMVTDRERDYMWNFYATDRRMRINMGIRRRLAPLMDNDRRKIELLNSLLFSMPGTPIVYYGDEIGMGDNIYLGDRDGVRTPMQWSPDRNGGFSKADPARLYLPAIMDPIYGYQAVNVEAQQRSSSSLLNWMKRMIEIRRNRRALGRGTLHFLYPGNRKILAYVREHDGERILCVANLSRSAQAVELDLSQDKGCVPVEMLGRAAFPPIGELPYLLTLPPYGFYWFALTQEAEQPIWHETTPTIMPDFVTLVMRNGWQSFAEDQAGRELVRDVLPVYLPHQRWFGDKDRRIAGIDLANWAVLPGRNSTYLLAVADVHLEGESRPVPYQVPLAVNWDETLLNPGSAMLPYIMAKARRANRVGVLHDAAVDEDFARALVGAIEEGDRISAGSGAIAFARTSALVDDLPEDVEVRRLGVEQSNSSILIGETGILKLYRRLAPGIHPELEVARFLTEVAHYANTPPLLGYAVEQDGKGAETALAIFQGFVRNQGDGWAWTQNYLGRELEEMRLGVNPSDVTPEQRHAAYMALVHTLGRRTAELHVALATRSGDPAFDPEPIGQADIDRWRRDTRDQAEKALAALERLGADLPEESRAEAERLLARRDELLARIDQLTRQPIDAAKTRHHGDYHLGQVLLAQDDFYIIDFEGEPAKDVATRRAKHSPLRDVAGMLRSFDYAAWAAVFQLADTAPERRDELVDLAMPWRDGAVTSFMEGYRRNIDACPSYPDRDTEADALLDLFTLEKACYEIVYEAANRPNWLMIPVKGVLGILDGTSRPDATAAR